jgi:hypothetical protein
MRFLTFSTLTILTGGLLAAADSATVTYIDGKTALHSIQIPYAQISKAELGVIVPHTPDPEPLYKVWALPKRLVKTETQQMKVAFTDENGRDQTMTLEMPKTSVDGVLGTIERYSPKVANTSWWGDGVWKTTRNRDTWGGAGTVAQK